MKDHPDPMGYIASYILDKEGTRDVIIMSLDKETGQIDVSAATKDFDKIDTTLKHRHHMIDLLKFVLADMEKEEPKQEGSYLTNKDHYPEDYRPNPGNDEDDSTTVSE